MSSIIIELTRYRPEEDETPWQQSFTLAWTQDMSILDALGVIKDEMEPTLAYRWSCRMEVCGSCGMVINGVPKLACSTFVRDYADVGKITIAPLDQMPVEKDLIVDVQPFVEKIAAVTPYILPKKADISKETAYRQTPKQLAKFKQYTMCINCMLCYQACPQIGINADFLGPAAISLAHRYNLDSRDAGAGQRARVLNREDGIWPCTFVGYCSEVCPKHVDPAGAIQQAKATAIPYWLMSLADKAEEEV